MKKPNFHRAPPPNPFVTKTTGKLCLEDRSKNSAKEIPSCPTLSHDPKFKVFWSATPIGYNPNPEPEKKRENERMSTLKLFVSHSSRLDDIDHAHADNDHNW
ncbi:MAG: hypothetical protein ACU843_11300, partial [Gammaproteobacteria bacterium]